jgi:phosphatidylglycerol:prolipoprotein diacylglycerol transferase
MLAPDIDPIAVQLGPIKVHWYGIMYLVGFLGAWGLGAYRAKRPGSGWQPAEIADLLFYGALGVILGGRIGYVLFYNFGYYLEHPIEVFYIWTGGMSFHGGLLGVITAMWLYGRRTHRTFFGVADFVAPLTPLGLGAGRLGNFINHELWGRITDVPWGMVFPNAGPLPRHPSQLYEFSLEGVALFVILWIYARKPRPEAAVSGVFLCCYGIFRFLVEFVREPDAQLGYLAFGWVTMGQILSLPMIMLGIWLFWWAHKTGHQGYR